MKPELQVDKQTIHAKHGSMQKIQILFPDPLMARVRALAVFEDRPVSEIVRRAVERLVEQSPRDPANPSAPKVFPTFHGGTIKAGADDMKSLLYADEHV